ncbi:EAL domain-containing protein [Actibacterium sp. 188UL27-1]|nr:EAL domain-containing protein [Actibacterium sp. 188UL27-1]
MIQPTDPTLPNPISAALALRNRHILRTVREALDRGDAFLLFQPVVDARSPEKTAFYEGLIRITDDMGRVIPARDFMQTCEADDLGRIIDCKALELGLQTLQARPDIRLSINMSARSIYHDPWIETFRRGIHDDPTLAERLILEITESSAMVSPDITALFMEEMQTHGTSFALDDFGAGYTSLRHLKDFKFDILKIDQCFIRNLDTDPDNRALVTALRDVARHFDLFTVAEGVETGAEAQIAAELGIDCLQGYHFSKPATLPHPDGLEMPDRRSA